MNKPDEIQTKEVSPQAETRPAGRSPRLRWFLAATGGLVLLFAVPLYGLLRFAIGNQLYSHLPLIAGISLYLVWTDRSKLPAFSAPDYVSGLVFLVAGLGACVARAMELAGTTEQDHLALSILGFVFFFGSLCSLFLGRPMLRALAFPLGFLVFMAPFPVAVADGIETFLQHGSADVAFGLFRLAGTSVYRTDLIFMLPGITLEVAPECSGIHSSLVLLITSLLAARLFLRTPWKSATLALAVIPLALLRNGFRVFIIGELCVRISPDMINSFVHRQGGPLFFAASLVPLGILLYFLCKSDRPVGMPPPRSE